MSLEAGAADGVVQGNEGSAQPSGGSSFLTSGVEPPAQAQQPAATPPATAQATAQAPSGDRPEWMPEKFWDPEKKAARTEDLAKGYSHLEKLLSGDKVPLPKSEDDKEGWERFYKAAGRPDKPDGYEFGKPEDLPAAVPYDDDGEKFYKELAHRHGLSTRQAKGVFDEYVKREIDARMQWAKAAADQREGLESALKREHGGSFDQVVRDVKGVVSRHADAEFLAFLDQQGLGNDPRMVRFLHSIGKELKGGTSLKGSTQPGESPGHTPMEIAAKIADFRKRHYKELTDGSHPSHKVRVDQLMLMHEQQVAAESRGAA